MRGYRACGGALALVGVRAHPWQSKFGPSTACWPLWSLSSLRALAVPVVLALHSIHLSEETSMTGLLVDPRLKRGDYFGAEVACHPRSAAAPCRSRSGRYYVVQHGKLSHLGVNTVGVVNQPKSASKGTGFSLSDFVRKLNHGDDQLKPAGELEPSYSVGISPQRELSSNTIGGDWLGHMGDAPLTKREIQEQARRGDEVPAMREQALAMAPASGEGKSDAKMDGPVSGKTPNPAAEADFSSKASLAEFHGSRAGTPGESFFKNGENPGEQTQGMAEAMRVLAGSKNFVAPPPSPDVFKESSTTVVKTDPLVVAT